MQSVLEHEAVRIAGALGVSRSATGITPRRLPRWASAQIVDQLFQFAASSASGVRLTFSTDSDMVELDVMLRGIEYPGRTNPVPCFDLVVDGNVLSAHETTEGDRWVVSFDSDRAMTTEFRPGDAETIRFDGLGGDLKQIELWLPQGCIVELRALRIAESAVLEPARRAAKHWVHYGSSISQCSEADHPTNIWPAVAARAAGVDLTNMGFGGQCHLDQVVARTIRDLSTDGVDFISAKVGINVINADSMRERVFVPALHGFIDTVRDGHPETPLLISTPILFPIGEDHPGPTLLIRGKTAVVDRPVELALGALTIGRIRELIEMVVTARQQAGDSNLHMLDGRELFGEGDLADLPDGLHPNTAGYQRMGERFASRVFSAGGPFGG